MLKELLYPKMCVFCGELLETDVFWGGEKESGKKICACCEKKYKIIKEPYCMKCGKPLQEEEGEYCLDCGQNEFYFLRNRSVYLYEEQVKEAMYALKRRHCKENGVFFGEQIADVLGEWIVELKVDVIIPIPLQKRRLRIRGYNQAGVMAKKVGKLLDIAVDEKVLLRAKGIKAQKKLSRKERKINIKNAFKIGENEVQYDRVLLVDDIYTTGATLNAATETLMRAGTREVYTVTACIGKGY